MLLKMGRLVSDIFVFGKGAAEVRHADDLFQFLKPCQGQAEFEIEGAISSQLC